MLPKEFSLHNLSPSARASGLTRWGHKGEGQWSPMFSTLQWKQKWQYPPLATVLTILLSGECHRVKSPGESQDGI